VQQQLALLLQNIPLEALQRQLVRERYMLTDS